MSVLITGMTGFVGQNLSAYLSKENIEFKSLGRSKDTSDFDYGDIKQISGFKTWIHTAGKAHDVSGKSQLEDYLEVNFELTKRVFDGFLRDESATCFIYLSSVKAAASSVDKELTEEVRSDLNDAYGISKRKAEDYLLGQAGHTTKKIIILRPCMIHGPGNKGNLNLLFNLVKKGIPYPLGAFENSRSFLSIDNLSFVIHKQIVDESLTSGVYNIADDSLLSTKDLIHLMADVRNTKARIWNIPKSLINFMASVGDVFRLPLNHHRLNKLTEDFRVSNAKLKSSLQMDRLPVSAMNGMKRTLESFDND